MDMMPTGKSADESKIAVELMKQLSSHVNGKISLDVKNKDVKNAEQLLNTIRDLKQNLKELDTQHKSNYYAQEAANLKKITDSYERYNEAVDDQKKKREAGNLVRWTNAYQARDDFDQSKISNEISELRDKLFQEFSISKAGYSKQYSVESFREIFNIINQLRELGEDPAQFSNVFKSIPEQAKKAVEQTNIKEAIKSVKPSNNQPLITDDMIFNSDQMAERFNDLHQMVDDFWTKYSEKSRDYIDESFSKKQARDFLNSYTELFSYYKKSGDEIPNNLREFAEQDVFTAFSFGDNFNAWIKTGEGAANRFIEGLRTVLANEEQSNLFDQFVTDLTGGVLDGEIKDKYSQLFDEISQGKKKLEEAKQEIQHIWDVRTSNGSSFDDNEMKIIEALTQLSMVKEKVNNPEKDIYDSTRFESIRTILENNVELIDQFSDALSKVDSAEHLKGILNVIESIGSGTLDAAKAGEELNNVFQRTQSVTQKETKQEGNMPKQQQNAPKQEQVGPKQEQNASNSAGQTQNKEVKDESESELLTLEQLIEKYKQLNEEKLELRSKLKIKKLDNGEVIKPDDLVKEETLKRLNEVNREITDIVSKGKKDYNSNIERIVEDRQIQAKAAEEETKAEGELIKTKEKSKKASQSNSEQKKKEVEQNQELAESIKKVNEQKNEQANINGNKQTGTAEQSISNPEKIKQTIIAIKNLKEAWEELKKIYNEKGESGLEQSLSLLTKKQLSELIRNNDLQQGQIGLSRATKEEKVNMALTGFKARLNQELSNPPQTTEEMKSIGETGQKIGDEIAEGAKKATNSLGELKEQINNTKQQLENLKGVDINSIFDGKNRNKKIKDDYLTQIANEMKALENQYEEAGKLSKEQMERYGSLYDFIEQKGLRKALNKKYGYQEDSEGRKFTFQQHSLRNVFAQNLNYGENERFWDAKNDAKFFMPKQEDVAQINELLSVLSELNKKIKELQSSSNKPIIPPTQTEEIDNISKLTQQIEQEKIKLEELKKGFSLDGIKLTSGSKETGFLTKQLDSLINIFKNSEGQFYENYFERFSRIFATLQSKGLFESGGLPDEMISKYRQFKDELDAIYDPEKQKEFKPFNLIVFSAEIVKQKQLIDDLIVKLNELKNKKEEVGTGNGSGGSGNSDGSPPKKQNGKNDDTNDIKDKIKQYKELVNEYIKIQNKMRQITNQGGDIPSLVQDRFNSLGERIQEIKSEIESSKKLSDDLKNEFNKINVDYALGTRQQEQKDPWKDTETAYQTLIENAKKYVELQSKINSGKSLTFNQSQWMTEFGERYREEREQVGLFAEANNKAVESAKQLKIALTEQKEAYANSLKTDIESTFDKLGETRYISSAESKLKSYKKEANDLFNELSNLKELKIGEKIDSGRIDEILQKLLNLKNNLTGYDKDLYNLPALDVRVQNLNRRMEDWMYNNSAATGAIQQIRNLQSSLDGVSAGGLKDVEAEFERIKSSAAQAGSLGKSFSDMLKKSFSGLARYLMTYASFYRIVGTIKQAVNIVKELDSALTEVRKVSTETLSSLKEWQGLTFSQADKVGTTAKQIQESTAAWLRLGKTFTEAQEAAQASSWLLNVSEYENIDDATTSLVSISQAYKDLDFETIIDKLNNVGDHFSSATDQLASGLQNTAAVLKVQGNDIDKSLALLTAGKSLPENVETYFKNIFNCVERLKTYTTIMEKSHYESLKTYV